MLTALHCCCLWPEVPPQPLMVQAVLQDMLCLWPEVLPQLLMVQAVLQDMLCLWPEVPPQPLKVQAVLQDMTCCDDCSASSQGHRWGRCKPKFPVHVPRDGVQRTIIMGLKKNIYIGLLWAFR